MHPPQFNTQSNCLFLLEQPIQQKLNYSFLSHFNKILGRENVIRLALQFSKFKDSNKFLRNVEEIMASDSHNHESDMSED